MCYVFLNDDPYSCDFLVTSFVILYGNLHISVTAGLPGIFKDNPRGMGDIGILVYNYYEAKIS